MSQLHRAVLRSTKSRLQQRRGTLDNSVGTAYTNSMYGRDKRLRVEDLDALLVTEEESSLKPSFGDSFSKKALAFKENELEEEFIEQYFYGYLRNLRRVFLAASFIEFAFAFVYMPSSGVNIEFYARLLAASWAALLFVISFIKKLRKYYQEVFAFGLFMACIILAWNLWCKVHLDEISQKDSAIILAIFHMIIIIMIFTGSHLKFWIAVSTGACCIVEYIIFQLAFFDIHASPIAQGVTFLLFLMVILVPLAYSMEIGSRREYFNRKLVLHEMFVVKEETEKADRMLLNVLPVSIAQRLKNGEDMISDSYESATVFFADIFEFHNLTNKMNNREMVSFLDRIVTTLDDCCDRFGVEKIKTIGDAYMAVAGAPIPIVDHAQVMAEFALEVMDAIDELAAELGVPLKLMVGLHSGPIIAGVIASRMQYTSMAGRIQITESLANTFRGSFTMEERGTINIKGKGLMKTYFLTGIQQSKSKKSITISDIVDLPKSGAMPTPQVVSAHKKLDRDRTDSLYSRTKKITNISSIGEELHQEVYDTQVELDEEHKTEKYVRECMPFRFSMEFANNEMRQGYAVFEIEQAHKHVLKYHGALTGLEYYLKSKSSEAKSYPYLIILLFTICIFTVSRIRFFDSVPIAAIALLIFTAVNLDSLYLSALYLVIVILSSISSYSLEYFQRVNFVLYLMQKGEKGRLVEIKSECERLLSNILPTSVIRKAKNSNTKTTLQGFESASVLFSDIVGFTSLTSKLNARELVYYLNDLFCKFDELALKHGVEKIKTIGDAYMCVCGIPDSRPDHAIALVRMGLAMQEIVDKQPPFAGAKLQMRVGISSGRVVGGMIGRNRLCYDIWGPSVQLASLMEQNGLPNAVAISEQTLALIQDAYSCQSIKREITFRGNRVAAFCISGHRPKPLDSPLNVAEIEDASHEDG